VIVWIASWVPPSRRFVFLDRDGVLNEDREDYVKNVGEFRFYGDALESLRRLREAGVGVVLASNQSGLGRGIVSWEDFWEMHERMVEEIRRAGGELSGALYCPHRPEDGCSCRKPAPGMLLEAAEVLGARLKESFMVGDRGTDLEADARAGATGLLLDRFGGEGGRTASLEGGNRRSFGTLGDAVDSLLKEEGGSLLSLG